MNSRACKRDQKGAALVEFAIMALVLYMIVAGGIELGRAIFAAQTIQDAARVAARELALTPVAATDTFDCPAAAQVPPAKCAPDTSATNDPDVLGRVWNPHLLVIDIGNCYKLPDGGLDTDAFNAYVTSLPAVNRALQPLFINEIVTVNNTVRHFLRYPGALLIDNSLNAGSAPCPTAYDPALPFNPTHFTVGIPQVTSRDDTTGVETIKWVPVLEEIRPNADDPTTGSFSFASAAATGAGLVSISINYPFQSAALTGFRNKPVHLDKQGDPTNFANAIPADDGGVGVQNTPPDGADPTPPATDCPETSGSVAPCLTYSGAYGLGKQYAFAGTVSTDGSISPTNAVRPYRVLLSGQATFRREVTK